jgi:type II secretory pathway component PulC
MKYSRIITLILCLCAIIIWIFNGFTAFSFIAPRSIKTTPLKSPREIFLSEALASTDSALKITTDLHTFQFSATMENPFKPVSEADPPVMRRQKVQAPETQVKLLLKGVLLKAKPLAILEDGAGKTYICGVGETVCDQMIDVIEATRVTLHNNLGRYSLNVKE